MALKYDPIKAGIQNLRDGQYIKEKVIPQALFDQHWNIVVAQTHFAAELILKGLIRLASGKITGNTHFINDLVDQFQGLLQKDLDAIPRLLGWWANKDRFYGLLLSLDENSGKVNEYVFKQINGIHSSMISYYVDATIARNAHYEIRKNADVVELYRNNILVTSLTDSSISQIPASSYKGASLLPIDAATINSLSTAIAALTHLKNKEALYGEVEQNENDAQKHIKHLDDLVEALKPFIELVEPIH